MWSEKKIAKLLTLQHFESQIQFNQIELLIFMKNYIEKFIKFYACADSIVFLGSVRNLKKCYRFVYIFR